jgi:hypothetical protein
VSELKYAIDNGLKDAMKLGAAEASVSEPRRSSWDNSIDEVQGLVSAVIKELVPVLGTRENQTFYVTKKYWWSTTRGLLAFRDS